MKQQNLLNKVFMSYVKGIASRSTVSRAKLMSITIVSISLLSLSSVALSGCTPSADTPSGTSSAQPSEPIPENPQSEVSLPSETLEGAPDIDSGAIGSTQLPEPVRTSVFEDIAASNNVPIDALEVEAAVPQTWSDGCLGLAGSDEFCTAALVDGWEVTVSQGDSIWVYRTDSDGFIVRADTSEGLKSEGLKSEGLKSEG